MKIATWNVNSLNVRLQQVLEWLDAAKPESDLRQAKKQKLSIARISMVWHFTH